MKYGVLLAGGRGTRLAPHTHYFSKSLITVKEKFLIEYPLHTLKSIGIEDVIIILGDQHYDQIVAHLKDGAAFGLNISYRFQAEPAGISHGINLAKNIIRDNDFVAILGDNVFLDNTTLFNKTNKQCQIVLTPHKELNRFGVASINDGCIASIKEKPSLSSLNKNEEHLAITGIYEFSARFFEYFKNTKPSLRQEFELVDVIRQFLNDDELEYNIIDGFWGDLGTFPAIKNAEQYIERIKDGIA